MDYNAQFEIPVYETPVQYAAAAELKHSGLGIASFILSLIAGVEIFTMVVIAGVMAAQSPAGIDEHSPEAIIVGSFLCGGAALLLVGLGLGIAGVLQRNRKKIFGILGLVFNALIVIGLLTLFAIGIAMRP